MAQRVNIEVLNKAAVDVQVQNSNAINVEVPTAPRDFVPRFTADKTDIKEGETVNFSASEAGFQYYWEIEDVGGFVLKNAKSVSHQFIDSGNFDIALTQADWNKQKAGTQIKRDFIKVVVPDFLLDIPFATGATAAYSLRRLKSSATKAVRVREDGSNTEADIGFSGPILDETALLNHVGSNNGFVTKWYDQSGNGNDASNVNNASGQPKIFDSTNGVIKENGKPALKFDGSDDFMVATISQQTIIEESVYGVITDTGAGGSNRFISQTNGSNKDFQINNPFIILLTNNTPDINQFDGSFINRISTSLNKQFLAKSLHTGSQAKLAKNNGNFITQSSNLNTKIDKLLIATSNSQGGELGASLTQEVIYYFDDRSSQDSSIETNINNFYSIF